MKSQYIPIRQLFCVCTIDVVGIVLIGLVKTLNTQWQTIRVQSTEAPG